MQEFAISNAFPLGVIFAFCFGFGARQIGLPPLVGFLVAGFVLNGIGVRANETIPSYRRHGRHAAAVHDRPETEDQEPAAGGSLGHGVGSRAGHHRRLWEWFLLALATLGLPLVADLSVETAFLVGFALSFSSTVFAVKVLEDKGELASLHGRTAIGILIMQDIFAVVFLTASTGKLPELWAPALIGLIFLRWPLFYLLDRVGHGELLPLFGFFAALALGVEIFELAGLKSDLGALVFGMLLAGHKKASEIADSLFSFKEIFLVGFFLNIGLSDLPTVSDVLAAVVLVVLLPFKTVLFLWILTRLRLRARTASLSSLVLSNYSEFGLIVGAIAVGNEWIGAQWLVAIAIAMSISFVVVAPFTARANAVYARIRGPLEKLEKPEVHPEEREIDTGDARVAIFGMGRIGTGAYDYFAHPNGRRHRRVRR